MKTLIKVMLIIAVVFGSTFIIGRALGILTEDNIRSVLEQASALSPATVFAIVVALLFIDLIVAVPTLTVVILGSYFMGFELGMLAAMTGSVLAAGIGYAISYLWGDKVLVKLVRNERERAEMREAFKTHGPGMILLARAAPMLPEITACMAGVTRMPLLRFFLFWSMGTLPYAAIASYAGSVSTLDNPMPAIYAALSLYAVMWTGWYIYRRRWMRENANARA